MRGWGSLAVPIELEHELHMLVELQVPAPAPCTPTPESAMYSCMATRAQTEEFGSAARRA